MFPFKLHKQTKSNNKSSNLSLYDLLTSPQIRLFSNSNITYYNINPMNNQMNNLYKPINWYTNCNKTIIHVYDYSNGLGDYLRGCILLAQYAKYFNIKFELDLSKHHISKCLHNIQPLLTNVKIHTFINEYNPLLLDSFIKNFLYSNEEKLYITTNCFYNRNLLTNDIQHYINSFFIFKEQYYNTINSVFNLKNYNVLHIRCLDTDFTTDFKDNSLLNQIKKIQLSTNTIVMSNNYLLKLKLNKLFGFYFIDNKSIHTVNVNNYKELESTIIDYIILSKSSRTYCISYYSHGSGFSEQCSILNNIPYTIIYIPNITKKLLIE
jgi:hypothetical protein